MPSKQPILKYAPGILSKYNEKSSPPKLAFSRIIVFCFPSILFPELIIISVNFSLLNIPEDEYGIS